MRHAKSRYQLNRFTSWRRATLISLVRNLLIYQRIKTTKVKAKAVKPWVDRLISLARDNNLSARREAYNILGSHRLVSLLFNDIVPRFNEKNLGGFTRILNLGARRGDNAKMALLELIAIKKIEKKKPKKEKEVKPQEEKKPKEIPEIAEKPTVAKKPSKKFFGGLRKIFKKERDSL